MRNTICKAYNRHIEMKKMRIEETYLNLACLRCGAYKLRQPARHGKVKTCLCDGCGKKCGYKTVFQNGVKTYALYLIGGAAKEKIHLRSHRLPERHAKLSTAELIEKLDKADGYQ